MYASSTNLQLAVGTRYLKGVCEMHDNRKRQARAAWKRRQERKRQRNAHAECEACAPKKPEALAEKMSKVWKRIMGAFV